MYYPKYASLFQEIRAKLHGKKVVILSHVRPDGDSIGSQVGLCRLLRHTGVEAVVVADVVPQALRPFVGDTPLYRSSALSLEDYIPVFVDCADAGRVEKPLQALYTQPFLNIDHHKSNTSYGVYNILDDQSAATAEILAGLCLDAKIPLDAVTAEAFYLGIATDTGQFLYASTSARVFELSTALIRHGAHPFSLEKALYQNEPLEKLQLLQRFLASIRLEYQKKIAIASLTTQDYLDTQTETEHSEGFVNYIRSIDSVSLAIFFDENTLQKTLKLSLRAKDARYRLDLLAKQFGGGGHACAAGLTVQDSCEHFLPRFLKEAVAHLEAREGDFSSKDAPQRLG